MVLESINPWLVLHVAGAVIAVGAVTVTDGFLAVFHFHPKFGKVLTRIAPLLSMIIWIGFFLISVSGIVLVLGKPSAVTDSLFRLKMLLTGIVFVNGAALNLWVTPRFQELAEHEVYELPSSFERRAGLAAAVSVVGWWTILFLAEFVI